MIFRQVLNDDLGCASYVVADAGEAAVIDPQWDIGPYLTLAEAHRFAIRHVLDTHVHADHVSGRRRLGDATGATTYLPQGSGACTPCRLLSPGDRVVVGGAELETIATPGHRPEHISFLVTDHSRSEEPCFLLSGDSLLVGDVARPDLAVSADGVDAAARALFGSLRRLSSLPDHVAVWPGHIGGSLCGAANVTGQVSSVLGFERSSNIGLTVTSEEGFVHALCDRIPERPPTTGTVVSLNRGLDGPIDAALPTLSPREVQKLLDLGTIVIDGRPARHFDAASIPGSLSIPLDGLGVGTKAAWFVRPEESVVAVASDDAGARTLGKRLIAVGLHNVKGILGGGMRSWVASRLPTSRTDRIDLQELARLIRARAVDLVDVRDSEEYDALHLPGSIHMPWRTIGSLDGLGLSGGLTVVVACATGGRTPFAASAIARRRNTRVTRLAEGGIADLAEYGIGLTSAAPDSEPGRALAETGAY